jgi:hypothetical protein
LWWSVEDVEGIEGIEGVEGVEGVGGLFVVWRQGEFDECEMNKVGDGEWMTLMWNGQS